MAEQQQQQQQQPPPQPPQQPTLEEVIQAMTARLENAEGAIQAADARANEARAETATLAGFLRRIPEEGAGGGMRQRLREFSNENPKDTYIQWERHLRAVAQCNRWKPDQVIVASKAAMIGQASDLAQALPNSVDHCTECDPPGTLEAYYKQLRKLFVSPAHERLARSQFDSRVQGPKEPIRVFHGLLLGLYTDGHAKIQEAWRDNPLLPVPAPYRNRGEAIGFKSQMLIQHFISGLRDRTVRERLLDQQIAQDKQFATYTDVLQAALGYMGNIQQSNEDQLRIKQGGARGHRLIKEYDYLSGANTGDKEEPMEIGAIQDRQQGQQDCRLHPGAGHSDARCIVQRKKKMAANRGPVTTTKVYHGKPSDMKTERAMRKNGKVDRATAKCNRCGGIGHFERECPSAPTTQGKSGARSRVNVVVDEDQMAEDENLEEVGLDEEEEGPEYVDSDAEEDLNE